MRSKRVNRLTQKYLKECLTYNQDTGIFTWNKRPESHFKNLNSTNRWNTIFSNTKAGCIKSPGYLFICINYKTYSSHRLAFLYMEGYMPENLVDHIDRDKANNKWSNLREVSDMCNGQNCNLSKVNTSGVTGVYLDKKSNKWIAQMKTNFIQKKLGTFENFDDAVMRRYQEEVNNPLWTCSVESTSYKYLKERNLI